MLGDWNLRVFMVNLDKTNSPVSRYTLSGRGAVFRNLNSMLTIKRYLRWAVLGLIFVLTASVNLFCVVIDNDDDGDPTTGLTIEFTAVQGKKIPVVASPVHLKSPVASKVFPARVFHNHRFERSTELNTNSSFSSLIDLLGPPLRC
jgi:hypothetical protein